MRKIITRTILLLSLVSLFNDISSEMLIPIMPLFLTSIGFSTLLIGVLEGFAEAVAGLTKMYFGKMSDETGKRMLFVRLGYLMSALSKPMLAAFSFPAWIFSARTLDRLGKGVRTSARDALLSDETLPENKGTVFGFHRAMDTAGAALGPVAALIYLRYRPADYSTIFLIAFLPSLVGVILTFFIRERKWEKKKAESTSFFEKFLYWKKSSPKFKQLMIGLLFFGLMNSSDAFILLRAKQITHDDTFVLASYILYNIVFALFAVPLGRMADKFGLKPMIVFGLFIFAIVYAGFAQAESKTVVVTLLFLYGLYAAATDGVGKALISNMVPRAETASAIGFFTGWNSVCVLFSSSMTGLIWDVASPALAFSLSAGGSLIAAIYLATRKLSASAT